MKCRYFGKCGSCKLYLDYEKQLRLKVDQIKEKFSEFEIKDFEIFPSKESHFRARAEFRIFFENDKIFYAMHSIDKTLLPIDECPIVLESIFNLMPNLIRKINQKDIFKEKLFSIEFLSSLNGETLTTLIYHKKLNKEWEVEVREISKKLGILIIGRSRGQKVVLDRDYVLEKLKIFDKSYTYIHKEATFTQPNPYVNQKMIEFAKENSKDFGGDLLELYCGSGNFTLPLSENFEKVLATEVSKNSIKTALENCKLNEVENIKFVRLSSEEFVEAFRGKREFKRLKQAEVNLKDYNFSTIFVDPPRAGLDETTRELVKNFQNIIYISCNPDTLKRDLKDITKTHKIQKFAMFDQFAYTPHMECGVFLVKSES